MIGAPDFSNVLAMATAIPSPIGKAVNATRCAPRSPAASAVSTAMTGTRIAATSSSPLSLGLVESGIPSSAVAGLHLGGGRITREGDRTRLVGQPQQQRDR